MPLHCPLSLELDDDTVTSQAGGSLSTATAITTTTTPTATITSPKTKTKATSLADTVHALYFYLGNLWIHGLEGDFLPRKNHQTAVVNGTCLRFDESMRSLFADQRRDKGPMVTCIDAAQCDCLPSGDRDGVDETEAQKKREEKPEGTIMGAYQKMRRAYSDRTEPRRSEDEPNKGPSETGKPLPWSSCDKDKGKGRVGRASSDTAMSNYFPVEDYEPRRSASVSLEPRRTKPQRVYCGETPSGSSTFPGRLYSSTPIDMLDLEALNLDHLNDTLELVKSRGEIARTPPASPGPPGFLSHITSSRPSSVYSSEGGVGDPLFELPEPKPKPKPKPKDAAAADPKDRPKLVRTNTSPPTADLEAGNVPGVGSTRRRIKAAFKGKLNSTKPKLGKQGKAPEIRTANGDSRDDEKEVAKEEATEDQMKEEKKMERERQKQRNRPCWTIVRHKPPRKYTSAEALFIRWSKSESSEPPPAIKRLEKLLRDDYHFGVQHCALPHTSEASGVLAGSIAKLISGRDEDTLIVVYYAGPAKTDSETFSIRPPSHFSFHRSWSGPPQVDLQEMFQNTLCSARADVLLLLDAPYACVGPRVPCEGKEIIAACGESYSCAGECGFGFTQALCRELESAAWSKYLWTVGLEDALKVSATGCATRPVPELEREPVLRVGLGPAARYIFLAPISES